MDSSERFDISPEFDPDTGSYRVTFDSEEYRFSTAVVFAVGAVSDSDPLSLPALNDRVDPECLDGVFGPKEDGTPRTGGRVVFPFVGYEVTVDSDGVVVVDPREG